MIDILGGKCTCCGVSEWWNLCIDHIEPLNGTKREKVWTTYIFIREYPEDARNEFQLLCFGCNASKNKYYKCVIDHGDDLN
jgi:hypothetical protein